MAGRVRCTVAPGDGGRWVFVVGDAFVVFVPVGTDASVVNSLVAVAERPEIDIEELVARLPLAGDSAIEHFGVAVVGDLDELGECAVSVIVRGDAAVDVYSVGGSRRFTDRGIRPWLLADFKSVIALAFHADGDELRPVTRIGDGMPFVQNGLVADEVDWSAVPDASRRAPAQQVEPAASAPAPEAAAPVAPALTRRPDGREHEHDTLLRPPRIIDETVLRDELPGDETVLRVPERPDVLPVDSTGIDLTTLVPPPRRRFAFRIGAGESRSLDAPAFIGRRPRAARVTRGSAPTLITVSSPTKAVSSTHLEVRQEGDSVVVTDLRSTNGSVVVPPGGESLRLRPGESLVVAPGAVVQIGDGNIVEILPPDQRETLTPPEIPRRRPIQ